GHDQVDGVAQLRRQGLALEELTIADDHGERIVELVGHAGHELADRGKLARLYQLRLRLLELTHPGRELLEEPAVLDGERGGRRGMASGAGAARVASRSRSSGTKRRSSPPTYATARAPMSSPRMRSG